MVSVVYIIFHLELIFDTLVRAIDFVARTEYEINEWYYTNGDKNTHYYRDMIEVEDVESYLAQFKNDEGE